jgi:hypothetical protein
MGNRAVITEYKSDSSECIYLHWNGGRASVEGFLLAAGILDLCTDQGQIDWDRFAQVIAKRFFECEVGMTVYRMKYREADKDNGDNGVYVIDKSFRIVERSYMRGDEEVDREKTMEIVRKILGVESPRNEVSHV